MHARTAVNGIFFCKHAAILLPELTPSYLRPNSLCTLRTRVQLQGGKCDGRVFVNKCNGHSIYWTQSLVLLCPSCQRMYIEVKFTAGGKFRYRLAVTLHAMCHCGYFPSAMFRLVDLDCEWIRANDFVSSLSICIWRKINCLVLFGFSSSFKNWLKDGLH